MSDPTHTQPPPDRRLKIPHLVFGLLFLGVAAIWALGASDLISGERLTVLAPAVLVTAGVIGLAASLASGRNQSRARAAHEHVDSYESVAYDADTAEETDHRDDDRTQEIR
jgi:hypothetical protein